MLGVIQIIVWGSTLYLPATLAPAIAAEMGWSAPAIMGGLSAALVAAALASPVSGRLIGRRGGRDVMAGGLLLMAVGLLLIASSGSLPAHYLGWTVLGGGMSACMFDAASSALGRLFGQSARSGIAALALWSGFASTICWPLSGHALSHLGWRGTIAGYAVVHLALCLPLLICFVPGREQVATAPQVRDVHGQGGHGHMLVAFGVVLVLTGLISPIFSTQLLIILQSHGMSLSEAVAIGALFGPAQVAVRSLDMFSGGRLHPRMGMITAAGCMALGLALLGLRTDMSALAIICYGIGGGLFAVARATLPLALFGPDDYPAIMGRLVRPFLLAQAAAPSLGAVAFDHGGAGAVLSLLFWLTMTNLFAALLLFRIT